MEIIFKAIKNKDYTFHYFECSINHNNKVYKGYGVDDDKLNAILRSLSNAWIDTPYSYEHHLTYIHHEYKGPHMNDKLNKIIKDYKKLTELVKKILENNKKVNDTFIKITENDIKEAMEK